MIKIQIKLDKVSNVPLYLQVKKQIMYLIRNDILKVGNRMPTERELSENLKVSRNTISSAYNELEQEGVLRSYQGKGTFVAEDTNPWKVQTSKEKIIKFIDFAFEEAVEMGVTPNEFIEIVTKRVKEKRKLMKKITAAYVECNIEQSRMFSKQLTDSTNINVVPLTLNDLKSGKGEVQDVLNNCQVIISTFNHVNEVVSLTSELKKEVLGLAISVDLETIVKIARYPDKTRFAFVCISNEFMFKAKGALEKAGLGNIDIKYTNTVDDGQLKKVVDASDVIIVSPGRYEDVRNVMSKNKQVLKFVYNLDDDSVKALKSRIVELKYQN